jgi:uncharacterized protein (TIGR03382 family)
MGNANWWFMDVIGPVLLLIALVWLVMRRRSRGTDHTTESGTRRVYDEEEARRREGTDGL